MQPVGLPSLTPQEGATAFPCTTAFFRDVLLMRNEHAKHLEDDALLNRLRKAIEDVGTTNNKSSIRPTGGVTSGGAVGVKSRKGVVNTSDSGGSYTISISETILQDLGKLLSMHKQLESCKHHDARNNLQRHLNTFRQACLETIVSAQLENAAVRDQDIALGVALGHSKTKRRYRSQGHHPPATIVPSVDLPDRLPRFTTLLLASSGMGRRGGRKEGDAAELSSLSSDSDSNSKGKLTKEDEALERALFVTNDSSSVPLVVGDDAYSGLGGDQASAGATSLRSGHRSAAVNAHTQTYRISRATWSTGGIGTVLKSKMADKALRAAAAMGVKFGDEDLNLADINPKREEKSRRNRKGDGGTSGGGSVLSSPKLGDISPSQSRQFGKGPNPPPPFKLGSPASEGIRSNINVSFGRTHSHLSRATSSRGGDAASQSSNDVDGSSSDYSLSSDDLQLLAERALQRSSRQPEKINLGASVKGDGGGDEDGTGQLGFSALFANSFLPTFIPSPGEAGYEEFLADFKAIRIRQRKQRRENLRQAAAEAHAKRSNFIDQLLELQRLQLMRGFVLQHPTHFKFVLQVFFRYPHHHWDEHHVRELLLPFVSFEKDVSRILFFNRGGRFILLHFPVLLQGLKGVHSFITSVKAGKSYCFADAVSVVDYLLPSVADLEREQEEQRVYRRRRRMQIAEAIKRGEAPPPAAALEALESSSAEDNNSEYEDDTAKIKRRRERALQNQRTRNHLNAGAQKKNMARFQTAEQLEKDMLLVRRRLRNVEKYAKAEGRTPSVDGLNTDTSVASIPISGLCLEPDEDVDDSAVVYSIPYATNPVSQRVAFLNPREENTSINQQTSSTVSKDIDDDASTTGNMLQQGLKLKLVALRHKQTIKAAKSILTKEKSDLVYSRKSTTTTTGTSTPTSANARGTSLVIRDSIPGEVSAALAVDEDLPLVSSISSILQHASMCLAFADASVTDYRPQFLVIFGNFLKAVASGNRNPCGGDKATTVDDQFKACHHEEYGPLIYVEEPGPLSGPIRSMCTPVGQDPQIYAVSEIRGIAPHTLPAGTFHKPLTASNVDPVLLAKLTSSSTALSSSSSVSKRYSSTHATPPPLGLVDNDAPTAFFAAMRLDARDVEDNIPLDESLRDYDIHGLHLCDEISVDDIEDELLGACRVSTDYDVDANEPIITALSDPELLYLDGDTRFQNILLSAAAGVAAVKQHGVQKRDELLPTVASRDKLKRRSGGKSAASSRDSGDLSPYAGDHLSPAEQLLLDSASSSVSSSGSTLSHTEEYSDDELAGMLEDEREEILRQRKEQKEERRRLRRDKRTQDRNAAKTFLKNAKERAANAAVNSGSSSVSQSPATSNLQTAAGNMHVHTEKDIMERDAYLKSAAERKTKADRVKRRAAGHNGGDDSPTDNVPQSSETGKEGAEADGIADFYADAGNDSAQQVSALREARVTQHKSHRSKKNKGDRDDPEEMSSTLQLQSNNKSNGSALIISDQVCVSDVERGEEEVAESPPQSHDEGAMRASLTIEDSPSPDRSASKGGRMRSKRQAPSTPSTGDVVVTVTTVDESAKSEVDGAELASVEKGGASNSRPPAPTRIKETRKSHRTPPSEAAATDGPTRLSVTTPTVAKGGVVSPPALTVAPPLVEADSITPILPVVSGGGNSSDIKVPSTAPSVVAQTPTVGGGTVDPSVETLVAAIKAPSAPGPAQPPQTVTKTANLLPSMTETERPPKLQSTQPAAAPAVNQPSVIPPVQAPKGGSIEGGAGSDPARSSVTTVNHQSPPSDASVVLQAAAAACAKYLIESFQCEGGSPIFGTRTDAASSSPDATKRPFSLFAIASFVAAAARFCARYVGPGDGRPASGAGQFSAQSMMNALTGGISVSSGGVGKGEPSASGKPSSPTRARGGSATPQKKPPPTPQRRTPSSPSLRAGNGEGSPKGGSPPGSPRSRGLGGNSPTKAAKVSPDSNTMLPPVAAFSNASVSLKSAVYWDVTSSVTCLHPQQFTAETISIALKLLDLIPAAEAKLLQSIVGKHQPSPSPATGSRPPTSPQAGSGDQRLSNPNNGTANLAITTTSTTTTVLLHDRVTSRLRALLKFCSDFANSSRVALVVCCSRFPLDQAINPVVEAEADAWALAQSLAAYGNTDVILMAPLKPQRANNRTNEPHHSTHPREDRWFLAPSRENIVSMLNVLQSQRSQRSHMMSCFVFGRGFMGPYIGSYYAPFYQCGSNGTLVSLNVQASSVSSTFSGGGQGGKKGRSNSAASDGNRRGSPTASGSDASGSRPNSQAGRSGGRSATSAAGSQSTGGRKQLQVLTLGASISSFGPLIKEGLQYGPNHYNRLHSTSPTVTADTPESAIAQNDEVLIVDHLQSLLDPLGRPMLLFVDAYKLPVFPLSYSSILAGMGGTVSVGPTGGFVKQGLLQLQATNSAVLSKATNLAETLATVTRSVGMQESAALTLRGAMVSAPIGVNRFSPLNAEDTVTAGSGVFGGSGFAVLFWRGTNNGGDVSTMATSGRIPPPDGPRFGEGTFLKVSYPSHMEGGLAAYYLLKTVNTAGCSGSGISVPAAVVQSIAGVIEAVRNAQLFTQDIPSISSITLPTAQQQMGVGLNPPPVAVTALIRPSQSCSLGAHGYNLLRTPNDDLTDAAPVPPDANASSGAAAPSALTEATTEADLLQLALDQLRQVVKETPSALQGAVGSDIAAMSVNSLMWFLIRKLQSKGCTNIEHNAPSPGSGVDYVPSTDVPPVTVLALPYTPVLEVNLFKWLLLQRLLHKQQLRMVAFVHARVPVELIPRATVDALKAASGAIGLPALPRQQINKLKAKSPPQVTTITAPTSSTATATQDMIKDVLAEMPSSIPQLVSAVYALKIKRRGEELPTGQAGRLPALPVHWRAAPYKDLAQEYHASEASLRDGSSMSSQPPPDGSGTPSRKPSKWALLRQTPSIVLQAADGDEVVSSGRRPGPLKAGVGSSSSSSRGGMITTLEDSYGPRSSSQRGGTPPTPRTATVVDASYRDQRALNNEVRVHLKILIPINQEALHRCNPNPELDGEVGPQHSAHHRNKKPTQNPPELTTTFTISQTPRHQQQKDAVVTAKRGSVTAEGPNCAVPAMSAWEAASNRRHHHNQATSRVGFSNVGGTSVTDKIKRGLMLGSRGNGTPAIFTPGVTLVATAASEPPLPVFSVLPLGVGGAGDLGTTSSDTASFDDHTVSEFSDSVCSDDGGTYTSTTKKGTSSSSRGPLLSQQVARLDTAVADGAVAAGRSVGIECDSDSTSDEEENQRRMAVRQRKRQLLAVARRRIRALLLRVNSGALACSCPDLVLTKQEGTTMAQSNAELLRVAASTPLLARCIPTLPAAQVFCNLRRRFRRLLKLGGRGVPFNFYDSDVMNHFNPYYARAKLLPPAPSQTQPSVQQRTPTTSVANVVPRRVTLPTEPQSSAFLLSAYLPPEISSHFNNINKVSETTQVLQRQVYDFINTYNAQVTMIRDDHHSATYWSRPQPMPLYCIAHDNILRSAAVFRFEGKSEGTSDGVGSTSVPAFLSSQKTISTPRNSPGGAATTNRARRGSQSVRAKKSLTSATVDNAASASFAMSGGSPALSPPEGNVSIDESMFLNSGSFCVGDVAGTQPQALIPMKSPAYTSLDMSISPRPLSPTTTKESPRQRSPTVTTGISQGAQPSTPAAVAVNPTRVVPITNATVLSVFEQIEVASTLLSLKLVNKSAATRVNMSVFPGLEGSSISKRSKRANAAAAASAAGGAVNGTAQDGQKESGSGVGGGRMKSLADSETLSWEFISAALSSYVHPRVTPVDLFSSKTSATSRRSRNQWLPYTTTANNRNKRMRSSLTSANSPHQEPNKSRGSSLVNLFPVGVQFVRTRNNELTVNFSGVSGRTSSAKRLQTNPATAIIDDASRAEMYVAMWRSLSQTCCLIQKGLVPLLPRVATSRGFPLSSIAEQGAANYQQQPTAESPATSALLLSPSSTPSASKLSPSQASLAISRGTENQQPPNGVLEEARVRHEARVAAAENLMREHLEFVANVPGVSFTDSSRYYGATSSTFTNEPSGTLVMSPPGSLVGDFSGPTTWPIFLPYLANAAPADEMKALGEAFREQAEALRREVGRQLANFVPPPREMLASLRGGSTLHLTRNPSMGFLPRVNTTLILQQPPQRSEPEASNAEEMKQLSDEEDELIPTRRHGVSFLLKRRDTGPVVKENDQERGSESDAPLSPTGGIDDLDIYSSSSYTSSSSENGDSDGLSHQPLLGLTQRPVYTQGEDGIVEGSAGLLDASGRQGGSLTASGDPNAASFARQNSAITAVSINREALRRQRHLARCFRYLPFEGLQGPTYSQTTPVVAVAKPTLPSLHDDLVQNMKYFVSTINGMASYIATHNDAMRKKALAVAAEAAAETTPSISMSPSLGISTALGGNPSSRSSSQLSPLSRTATLEVTANHPSTIHLPPRPSTGGDVHVQARYLVRTSANPKEVASALAVLLLPDLSGLLLKTATETDKAGAASGPKKSPLVGPSGKGAPVSFSSNPSAGVEVGTCDEQQEDVLVPFIPPAPPTFQQLASAITPAYLAAHSFCAHHALVHGETHIRLRGCSRPVQMAFLVNYFSMGTNILAETLTSGKSVGATWLQRAYKSELIGGGSHHGHGSPTPLATLSIPPPVGALKMDASSLFDDDSSVTSLSPTASAVTHQRPPSGSAASLLRSNQSGRLLGGSVGITTPVHAKTAFTRVSVGSSAVGELPPLSVITNKTPAMYMTVDVTCVVTRRQAKKLHRLVRDQALRPLCHLIVLSVSEDNTPIYKVNAATCVQRFFRGYVVRKAVRSNKHFILLEVSEREGILTQQASERNHISQLFFTISKQQLNKWETYEREIVLAGYRKELLEVVFVKVDILYRRLETHQRQLISRSRDLLLMPVTEINQRSLIINDESREMYQIMMSHWIQWGQMWGRYYVESEYYQLFLSSRNLYRDERRDAPPELLFRPLPAPSQLLETGRLITATMRRLAFDPFEDGPQWSGAAARRAQTNTMKELDNVMLETSRSLKHI